MNFILFADGISQLEALQASNYTWDVTSPPSTRNSVGILFLKIVMSRLDL
ncbi:MAG TPA: hypothetical protein V6C57_25685 [Coleofasciculaceae cyanobacterium]